jgi:hypothetical protein
VKVEMVEQEIRVVLTLDEANDLERFLDQALSEAYSRDDYEWYLANVPRYRERMDVAQGLHGGLVRGTAADPDRGAW